MWELLAHRTSWNLSLFFKSWYWLIGHTFSPYTVAQNWGCSSLLFQRLFNGNFWIFFISMIILKTKPIPILSLQKILCSLQVLAMGDFDGELFSRMNLRQMNRLIAQYSRTSISWTRITSTPRWLVLNFLSLAQNFTEIYPNNSTGMPSHKLFLLHNNWWKHSKPFSFN